MSNKPQTFSENEITSMLTELPGWTYEPAKSQIERVYVRKNFMDAVNFIREIALIAEARDHHPDILLSGYKNVKVMLSTHSAGGVTENDFGLARAIDNLKP